MNQLENAITQNPKAIIVAAVDGNAIVGGVEQANRRNSRNCFDRVISETKVDFTSVADVRGVVLWLHMK